MFKSQKSKLILVLIAATFFAYFSSLNNPFIWDDEQFITSNVFVQQFNIQKIFTTNTTAGAGVRDNYYRPLTSLSFAIDNSIWHTNTFGFHLTNLLLHIGAGILLFLLLIELGLGQWGSFFISLFFLVFPTQTEAVTYINSRGDSLFTLFLFGSLLVFQLAISGKYLLLPMSFQRKLESIKIWILDRVQDDKKKRSFTFVQNDKKWILYAGSILLYILSIFSKETAIAGFPLFFVLIFMKTIQGKQKFAQSMQLYAKAYLSAFASVVVVCIYMLLRLTVLNFSNVLNYYSVQNTYSTHLFIRLFTFAKVLWVYLGILLWPYPLHMERDVTLVTSPFAWQVWGILLLIIGIIAVSTWEIRKKHTAIILFGFVLSASFLIPVSGIVPINGMLYEHWLYIPMVGFWIMVYGIIKFSIFNFQFSNKTLHTKYKIQNTLHKLLISFAILLSILYIFLAIRQNNIWADPITFYTYTLSFVPNSARLHNNLGMSLADAGDNKGAIAQYKKALLLGSNYPQIYNNLGNAQMQTGDYTDAEKNLKKTLELAPNFGVAKQNLLKLYLLTKQYDKARSLSGNNPQVEEIIKELQRH